MSVPSDDVSLKSRAESRVLPLAQTSNVPILWCFLCTLWLCRSEPGAKVSNDEEEALVRIGGACDS